MTISPHKNELGAGIYTAAEIGRLLGYPTSKVSRLLRDYWDNRLGRELFDDTYTWTARSSKTKVVNFYVLIELKTFFALKDMGLSTHRILKSRFNIAKEIGVRYPFASSSILVHGRKILYNHFGAIIDADGTRQMNLSEIVKEFARKIDFRSDNSMAEVFWPAGRNSNVIVSPHHRFGEPVIKGTNINAEQIYLMYKSGEPKTSIKTLYSITDKDINDAIRFYNEAA